MRIQVKGKKYTLSNAQCQKVARGERVRLGNHTVYPNADQIARANQEFEPAPMAETAPVNPSGVSIGDLVASSMPKYNRVVIGRVARFDLDGEARGARDEHLGYINRRDNSGNRKFPMFAV